MRHHRREVYDSARDSCTETLKIMRGLCQRHPDKYQAKLADHLQEYGVSLPCRKMYGAACDVQAEAVTITCELYQLHPQAPR